MVSNSGRHQCRFLGLRLPVRSTQEILEGLENGRLDVAFSAGPDRETRGLKWIPLVRESWQLAMPRDHALARQSRITPADVGREPLLVFRQRDYPEYWELLARWLREHRQRPAIAGEYDGVTSLLAAVESGLGVAIVTRRAAGFLPRRVRLKTLAHAPPPLCIAAGLRADRAEEPQLATFVEGLRQVARPAGESAPPQRSKSRSKDGTPALAK